MRERERKVVLLEGRISLQVQASILLIKAIKTSLLLSLSIVRRRLLRRI